MTSASSTYPPGHGAPKGDARPHLSAEAPAGALRAQDHWRVNLAEAWEIAFWTRELGCTEAALRKAVEHAGNRAGAVRAFLVRNSLNNF